MTPSRRAWFRRLATILLAGSVRQCTTAADDPLAATARRMATAGAGWSGDTDASGLVMSPNPPPPKGCRVFQDCASVLASVKGKTTNAKTRDRLRLEEIWRLVSGLYDQQVEGDIVEAGGVGKGVLSMTMVASHQARKRLYHTRLYRAAPDSTRALDRHFWLFDAFGDPRARLDDVRTNLARTCYAPDKIHYVNYVKGNVEETLVNETNLPRRSIALLHLGTGLHPVAKAQLGNLTERMAPGTWYQRQRW
mmetsp:Transcript_36801/g.98788  ORF Transcript_36801/g.98788 Transcript_36801/m.98788 type:complete len:250 (+) Transcript_36801:208-957(+)